MTNEVLENLRTRRSIRKYKTDPIPAEAMEAVLDAGLWAASAKGLQATVMVAVEDAETLAQLSRWNAEVWGKPDVDPFYGAPAAILVLADGTVPTWLQDGSLVLGNLMTAAHAVGLGSCWINRAIETFDRPEGKALLKEWGLSETLRGVGYCILGIPDGEAPAPKARKDGRIVRIKTR